MRSSSKQYKTVCRLSARFRQLVRQNATELRQYPDPPKPWLFHNYSICGFITARNDDAEERQITAGSRHGCCRTRFDCLNDLIPCPGEFNFHIAKYTQGESLPSECIKRCLFLTKPECYSGFVIKIKQENSP